MKNYKQILWILFFLLNTISVLGNEALRVKSRCDAELLFNDKVVPQWSKEALKKVKLDTLKSYLTAIIDSTWTADLSNPGYSTFKTNIIQRFAIENFEDKDLDAFQASYLLIQQVVDTKNKELVIAQDLNVEIIDSSAPPQKTENEVVAKQSFIEKNRIYLVALISLLLGLFLGAMFHYLNKNKPQKQAQSSDNQKAQSRNNTQEMELRMQTVNSSMSEIKTAKDMYNCIEYLFTGSYNADPLKVKPSQYANALQLLKDAVFVQESKPQIDDASNKEQLLKLSKVQSLSTALDADIVSKINGVHQLGNLLNINTDAINSDIITNYLVESINDFEFEQTQNKSLSEQIGAFIDEKVKDLKNKTTYFNFKKSAVVFAVKAKVNEKIGITQEDENTFWELSNTKIDKLMAEIKGLKDQVNQEQLDALSLEFMKWTIRFYDVCKLKTEKTNFVPRYKYNFDHTVSKAESVKTIRGIKEFNDDFNKTSIEAIRLKQIANLYNAKNLEDISVLGFYISPSYLK